MKKIINGSLYNTATARRVGCWDNGQEYGSLSRADKDLYQTKSGKYFIHGYGGPMTTFAEHHGNSTSGGEQIIPLTAEEARQFAQENLSADTYAAEFGTPEEAADKIQTAFNLSAAAIAILKQKKAQTGMTMSELVETAIMEVYGS